VRAKGKRSTPIAEKGKRSTFKAQRSTFKENARIPSSLNVERWKLSVERLPIVVSNETTIPQSTISFTQKHLQSAHTILAPPLTDLSIALVGDKTMSALHQQFMNIPGPTDVLTFPLELNANGKPISGEVVICVPEARRRCRETKTELHKELLLYALHGLLHLCGFDDRTDRQFRRMHAMEDEILTRLGVGPVFDTRDAGGDD